jgi:RNA polymerase sigma-70 factor (ECF subfamily)
MTAENPEPRFTRAWLQAQPAVAAYLVATLGPRDAQEMDDLLQETALALLEGFASYDPRQPFVPWAVGVARNKLLMKWRAQGRSRVVSRDPDLLDALQRAAEELGPELSDRQHAMRDCVQQLEGRSWDLIRMRYDSGLPPQTIADRLGLKAGHVRVVLTRIREALRRCVEKRLAAQGGSP